MSSFTKELAITKIGKRKWKLNKTFIYQIGVVGGNDLVVVPEGFITDGASIPKIFWLFVGHPLAEYAQAAVLHDFLYNRKYFPRKRSDEIFYEAMGVLEVVKWKRIIMYQAVRRFGWIPWNRSLKRRKRMKKKVLNIIGALVVLLFLQGCVYIHFQNEKGIKADASDIKTKMGSIDEGNAYYWSRLNIWIPFRPSVKEGIDVSTNSSIE